MVSTRKATLPLPLKNENLVLPSNKNEVYLRTKNTLSRLSRDPDKLDKCIDVMNKYLNAGHMEMVPANEQVPRIPGRAWWIPILLVVHPKKNKPRLVFDSSATFKGTSLNSHLLSGPDLTNRLKDVLLGFRDGYIGFSADVESMFHSFYLRNEDRDFMRFFWFKNNDSKNEICQFRANVHIFGNTSSPSLAGLGLRYAVKDHTDKPHVLKFVNEQFYVDDGLCCADTVSESVQILKDTVTAFQDYNIRLHKISSSSQNVIDAFPSTEISKANSVEIDNGSLQATLGLMWDVSSDSLKVRTMVPNRPFTRRGMLAVINSVFDPLGICSPVVLEGKVLQRKIFSLSPNEEISWDEELPDDHKALWDDWCKNLELLSEISLHRCYRFVNIGLEYIRELHAFCDASEYATGYVIYMRSVSPNGEKCVSFVTASSKIAPKNSVSIPRLELCSALDVSQATACVADKLSISAEQVYLYTDSMITLGYLNNKERRFTRYVSRRVNMTLKSFPASHWKHVPTSLNPADIASRTQTYQSLKCTPWLTGPEFLMQDALSSEYEEPLELPETVDDAVSLKTVFSDCSNSILCNILTRIGSLIKAVNVARRVIGLSFVATDSARQRTGVSLAPRSSPSDDYVLNRMIIDAQISSVPEMFDSSRILPSHLASLNPFVDSFGIVRVGGRLAQSDLEYKHKYPILLPHDHVITNRIVNYYHCSVKHQGRFITMSAIREAGYYISRGSSLIRKFINRCVVCKKLRAKLSEQKMSDLPKDRLQCEPPFSSTGMDVFGPYSLVEGVATRRSNSVKKCWAIIFTCLNSRATHIEPLPSLDTNSLRNALRRFISIRGNCKKLRSDQGTNFVGVRNQEGLNVADVEQHIKDIGCEWELTPPKASHHGAVWERQIQMVKNILHASLHLLGNRLLVRDDFYTYLQECCSIINN